MLQPFLVRLEAEEKALLADSTPSVRRGSTAIKVAVATTVMLSFISFWRAAAIVLSDMASSAYYVGGIAETAVGKSAPWFILAIMLFSYAVRSIYLESCSLFVRGGVYKVVHEAMGGTLAKFSVSALMFDYVSDGADQRRERGSVSGGPSQRAQRVSSLGLAVYRLSISRRGLPFWLIFISGGRTLSGFTNRVRRPFALCRSRP